MKKHFLSSKGFTLIELLVVIAVLGVLATVVLVAINPVEQLARGRDAGRKSTVGQLANAAQAYFTSRTAYPLMTTGAEANAWITTLKEAGEIKAVPAATTYQILEATDRCTEGTDASPVRGKESDYCYISTTSTSGAADAVIYVRLESGSENTKCATGERAWFLWSSKQGQSGVVCTVTTAEPAALDGYTFK